jgi:hypothetical protein
MIKGCSENFERPSLEERMEILESELFELVNGKLVREDYYDYPYQFTFDAHKKPTSVVFEGTLFERVDLYLNVVDQ